MSSIIILWHHVDTYLCRSAFRSGLVNDRSSEILLSLLRGEFRRRKTKGKIYFSQKIIFAIWTSCQSPPSGYRIAPNIIPRSSLKSGIFQAHFCGRRRVNSRLMTQGAGKLATPLNRIRLVVQNQSFRYVGDRWLNNQVAQVAPPRGKNRNYRRINTCTVKDHEEDEHPIRHLARSIYLIWSRADWSIWSRYVLASRFSPNFTFHWWRSYQLDVALILTRQSAPLRTVVCTHQYLRPRAHASWWFYRKKIQNYHSNTEPTWLMLPPVMCQANVQNLRTRNTMAWLAG